MNYFAHARVAAGFDPHPAFVLGAMLPDFAGMLGARIQRIEDPRLRGGEAHHHRQDQAFHRSPAFRELVAGATRRLRERGVSRGPARGAAHVGVELLFDASLVGDAGGDGAYLSALAQARRYDAAIGWSRAEAAARWPVLHARLRDAGLPRARPDPQRVAERVARALEPRPTLRLAAHERPEVERWLRHAWQEVCLRGPAMLAQTLARLAAPGAGQRPL